MHLLSLSWIWGLHASGRPCYNCLLSIKFFWEEKTKMAVCCSPLKSVSIGPPENFNGIYGLSTVFVKAHLISSLGCASLEVRPLLFSLPVSQRFWRRLLSGMRNINRTPPCCYGDCSHGWSGDPGEVQGISICHVLQPLIWKFIMKWQNVLITCRRKVQISKELTKMQVTYLEGTKSNL